MYAITALPDIDDDLDRLSDPEYSRIRSAISRLAENPRPSGAIKLSDLGNSYRIRVGKYRIVYRIRDKELLVLVIAVAERGKIYPLAKKWRCE